MDDFQGYDYDYDYDYEEVKRPSFSNCFELLPADSPANHAHIIDGPADEDWPDSEVKIWDVIATVLHHLSPDTLKRFLNSENKSFRLLSKRPKSMTLVIWRKDTEVLVGYFLDAEAYDAHEWDNLVRCTISPEGAWEIKSASYRGYCKRDLDEAWAGRFRSTLEPSQSSFLIIGQNEKHRQDLASTLALGMLHNMGMGKENDITTT